MFNPIETWQKYLTDIAFWIKKVGFNITDVSLVLMMSSTWCYLIYNWKMGPYLFMKSLISWWLSKACSLKIRYVEVSHNADFDYCIEIWINQQIGRIQWCHHFECNENLKLPITDYLQIPNYSLILHMITKIWAISCFHCLQNDDIIELD